jgi:hypothetical protein
MLQWSLLLFLRQVLCRFVAFSLCFQLPHIPNSAFSDTIPTYTVLLSLAMDGLLLVSICGKSVVPRVIQAGYRGPKC